MNAKEIFVPGERGISAQETKPSDARTGMRRANDFCEMCGSSSPSFLPTFSHWSHSDFGERRKKQTDRLPRSRSVVRGQSFRGFGFGAGGGRYMGPRGS